METEFDLPSILNALRKATSIDVFLISFLALPFVFNAWLGIADKLGLSAHGKLRLLVTILVIYAGGMMAMFLGNSRVRQREVARDQIIGYMTSKGFKMVSFEGIRSYINKAYTDEFLESLTITFPNALRRAILKGDRPGLARIRSLGVKSDD